MSFSSFYSDGRQTLRPSYRRRLSGYLKVQEQFRTSALGKQSGGNLGGSSDQRLSGRCFAAPQIVGKMVDLSQQVSDRQRKTAFNDDGMRPHLPSED